MLSAPGMRPSMLAWPAAFVLASLTVFGCKTTVSVDDPDTDCQGEPPEIPDDAWCPPAYACIDGEWVDTAGACPEPACPATKPADGTDCQLAGQVCSYEEDVPCGPVEQVDSHCIDGGWVTVYNYCPPEQECPADLPVAGTDCTGWYYAYSCQYFLQTSCGEQVVFLSCSDGGAGMVWNLDSGSTCAVCNDHATEAECGATSECQWLTPGCGDQPTQMGCYPKVGCDVAACNDDSICVETTYDPCYGEACDACGAPYFACLPGWAP